MAIIGTIESRFLAPGISENGRLYTAETIQRAVTRMQERLADPAGLPIQMLSHHGSGDDSKEICARILTVSLDPETCEASLSGYLIDTRAGRDIAATLEPGPDGRRTLDSVSINGWWIGPVRTVEMDGRSVTTADDLEINTVDFTKSPGLSAARIGAATKAAAESAGPTRTPIRESVEVTVMSDSTLVHSTSTTPEIPPVETPAAEVKPKDPGNVSADSDSDYADPGMQPDKKARYPLDSATHVKAAASQIAKPANQKPYTAAQVATIKTRIKTAAKKFGVMVSTESAPTGDVTEAHPLAGTIAQLREAHVAISGWQGPVDIDLDAYGVSNDDAAAAMTQLGLAYAAALKVLDPDNDDDLDLPDGDEATACPTCSAALPDGANFCPACGMALTEDDGAPAAESDQKENPMSETMTATESDVAAAARRSLGVADDKPTETAKPAAEKAPEVAAPAVEAAPVKEDAVPDPATTDTAPAAAAPTTAPVAPGLTSADHDAIATKLAALLNGPAETVKVDAIGETVTKAVAEATDAMRAQIVAAYGTPRRAGLIEASERKPEVELHKLSPAELNSYAASVWNDVLGDPTL